MPYMLARRPMKRKRAVARRRTPGYRNGVIGTRMSQSANFRTGLRAIKPSTGSTSCSSVFTATTSGIGQQPGGFQLAITQANAGTTTWELPLVTADPCLTITTNLQSCIFLVGGVARQITFTGSSVFQGLYDFYRIDRVEIILYVGNSFVADASNSGAGPAAASSDFLSPVICYAVDSNDSAVITQSNLLSYANVQMKQCAVNAPITLSYKPAANADFGNTVGTAGAGPVFSPKINTSTPLVNHHGVKMCPMGLSATPPNAHAIAGCAFVVRQYVTFFDRRSAA